MSRTRSPGTPGILGFHGRRGEDIDSMSPNISVSAAATSIWRDHLPAGGSSSCPEQRHGDRGTEVATFLTKLAPTSSVTGVQVSREPPPLHARCGELVQGVLGRFPPFPTRSRRWAGRNASVFHWPRFPRFGWPELTVPQTLESRRYSGDISHGSYKRPSLESIAKDAFHPALSNVF